MAHAAYLVRQLWLWSTPAIAIASIAVVAGAVVEGVTHGDRAAVIVIAAGELCRAGVPLAAAVIALGRALWRGWQPVLDERSGAPIIAGAVYAVLTVAAVFAAGYGATHAGMAATKLPWVAAAIGAGGAAAAVLLALALARPALRGARSLVARLWPRITPRRAGLAVGLALVGLAIAGWLAVRPLLIRYDLGLAVFGAGALGGAALATAAVLRWPRARATIATAALAVAVVLAIAARVLAARDPIALIDAWSQLPVGGRAIAQQHEVAALRAVVVDAIPAPVARTERHPDILLITVDALRADRLGARRPDGQPLMPALDALAAEGAVFTRAFAPSTVTRGSLPAIMTQLSPGRLRGRLVDFALKLDPRHVLLAERLQRAGYATGGFLCCAHHFGGPFEIGLDRGLDDVVYDAQGDHLAAAAAAFFGDAALDRRSQIAGGGDPDGSAGGTGGRAPRGIDARPRFAWLHTYEPHLWGGLPSRIYGRAAGPRYDVTVAAVDRALAPLLAAIRARGRPTIVVVTSDHGEGLGDHGVPQHAGPPHASLIQVPLVIAGPAIAPRRIATVVGLLGLGDTLLELAGFAPPPSDGPSFAALLRGEPPSGPGEAYSVVLRDRRIPFSAHSLVAGDHHLIEVAGQPPELYDLSRDPAELDNLAAREPAVLARLRRRLADHRARDRVPVF
jgi:arylsulfatase A-like enzyme